MFTERPSFVWAQHARQRYEAIRDLPGELDEKGCNKGKGDKDSYQNFQTQVWQLQALEAAQLFL